MIQKALITTYTKACKEYPKFNEIKLLPIPSNDISPSTSTSQFTNSNTQNSSKCNTYVPPRQMCI